MPMAGEIRIYDEIEYKGEWWVVGEEDKRVFGVLTCSKKNQIKLVVIGNDQNQSSLLRHDHKDEPNFEIVLGDCHEGIVTLLFCDATRSEMRGSISEGSNKVKTTMLFEYAIFKKHYNSTNEIYFPAIIAEFSNLKYWLDSDLARVEMFDKLTFEENKMFDLSVRIERYKLKISSGYGMRDESEEYESAGIRYSCHLHFEPDKPQSLVWFFKVINKFKDFLSIYTDSNTHILSIQGVYYNGRHSERISICDVPSPDYKKVSLPRWGHLILSVYNISDNISQVLNNWYELEHQDILYTYIDNIPDEKRTINEKFLGYARIIESLHRLQDGNVKTTYVEPKEYKKIVDKMMNAVSEDIDGDLRKKLIEHLKHANEYGFQRRIKEVLKLLPDSIRDKITIGLKPSHYADVIRKNRDYYTHLHSNPQSIFNDFEMMAVNFSLKIISVFLISEKIGINHEQLLEVLETRTRWVNNLDWLKNKHGKSIKSKAESPKE